MITLQFMELQGTKWDYKMITSGQ